jgi:ribosome-associated toxin RatA of RatAB toxin-antitoxin module
VTTIERNALVHYSPDEMFQLVNNVGDYSAFLPWCRSSKVISESEAEMEASVEIAKGVLNQTFTTHNSLTQGQRIDIALVDGPFKMLSGYWQFDALKTENACKVNLVLEFEFDNAMISITARPVFTQIANSLVEAFCKRAVEVYGERG